MKKLNFKLYIIHNMLIRPMLFKEMERVVIMEQIVHQFQEPMVLIMECVVMMWLDTKLIV